MDGKRTAGGKGDWYIRKTQKNKTEEKKETTHSQEQTKPVTKTKQNGISDFEAEYLKFIEQLKKNMEKDS